MQFYEDQGEGEVHSYIFIPSKHVLTHYLISLSLSHQKLFYFCFTLGPFRECPLEVQLYFSVS